MEEFARGFPNQHTTHRDTRYICMQTFVSARGPGNKGDGQDVRRETMEHGDSAIAGHERRRRLYARRVYIFIRVYTHCERMRGSGVCERKCIRECVHTR